MKPRLDTVLAYVNMGRKALGLRALRKLPKGKIESARKCPLARALGVNCSPSTLKASERKRNALTVAWLGIPKAAYWVSAGEIPLPEALAGFVEAFDQGKYPTLVQK